jgi:hypothetical protein
MVTSGALEALTNYLRVAQAKPENCSVHQTKSVCSVTSVSQTKVLFLFLGLNVQVGLVGITKHSNYVYGTSMLI